MAKLNANEPIVPKTHVPEGATSVVKLRIRSDGGNIMLSLLPTDSVSAVYKYVRPYMEGKKFELCTNFPAKVYEESVSGSLKDLGLAPSCVMIVKLK